jgi:predicted SAM-dependent methyltransferase
MRCALIDFREMIRRLLRPWIRTQPLAVRMAAHNLLSEMRLARSVRRSQRQLENLRDKKHLKIHLGCGPELKPEWINIDFNPNPQGLENGSSDVTFINYDLRSGQLPFADNSCEIIYSSHFFEHLECAQGTILMRDCYRVLQPGGVFRISLPTFDELFSAYLARDFKHLDLVDLKQVLPNLEPGTETIVDHVNYGVYQNGEHKCIYDEEKICVVLRHIGFRNVGPSSFNPAIDPANELRQRYSFYVEAVK